MSVMWTGMHLGLPLISEQRENILDAQHLGFVFYKLKFHQYNIYSFIIIKNKSLG